MNGLRRNDAEAVDKAGTHETPLVAIVILTWNGKELLQKFLPFVMASSYANMRVIVVDNASDDETVAFLKQSFPEIEILTNPGNEGFAKGYNTALKQIQSDYYVLLNNDVEVTAGWIEPIIDLMESDILIAVCQPKILSYNKRDYFEYAGASGGWLDAFGYPFARGRIFDVIEEDKGQYDDAQPCFWASGAAMFVRAQVYHKVGGLDEYFFAHQEEIDFCWRSQRAGFKVYVQPESVVYHVGGSTLAKGNSMKTYLNFRNNLIMLVKNLPSSVLIQTVIIRFLLDAIAAWKALLTGDARFFIAIFKAHISFLSWLFSNQKKVSFSVQHLEKPKGWFASSVVWKHFIQRKNLFSEIVKYK